jgi:hypothetical protein
MTAVIQFKGIVGTPTYPRDRASPPADAKLKFLPEALAFYPALDYTILSGLS